MPRAAQETLAIVVGHTDYREADRIVQLLTAEHGRLPVLARSARRSVKRFGGALDLGNRVTAMLRPGRGELWHLDGADLDHGRPHLRDDLERITLAAYACELVSSLARTEQPEPRLYGLLDVALMVLDAMTAPPTPTFRLALEAKALTFAGLTPVLDRCVSCGEDLVDGRLVLDPSAGGLLHERCGGGVRLSVDDARALERARRTPLAELVDTPPPQCDLWLLYDLMCWQTGRSLKSKSMAASLEV